MHVKGPVTYCFGTGREAFSKAVISKENLVPDPAVPGPGSHNPLKPLGSEIKTFKLKSRVIYDDPADVARRRGVPPPGSYNEVLRINKEGNYNFNSEWSNSKAAKWGPYHDRFKRVKTTSDMTPGPGTHE